ncbi:hypothetical protein [Gillisia hiemivivida]|uniref:Uncharacterized protein n=1 Tax=Gillisia hiemivivida TaxID=291190 RepID=A0A5C6ZWS5_9FLAO|nr:hypothetical protein [Gillisia hiemivivida]TXD95337.1 hypothetical protein ES724_04080 [Gillisia hiemivivida]
MTTKAYIAISLVFILLGKFVTLETNIFDKLVNSDKISYVKKSCDLKNNKNSLDFEFTQIQDGVQITFDSFCNSVFQLEKPIEEKVFIQLSFKSNFRYIFTETKEFNYKFIPPPKFS